MRRASLFLLLCAACTDEPGICIEKTRINSEAQQVCYEVDSPGVCPTLYTGDEAGELEFGWVRVGSHFRNGAAREGAGTPALCHTRNHRNFRDYRRDRRGCRYG